MSAYVVRRIAATIPLLLVGTFLVYVLTALSSNPLDRIAACENCGPEARQAIIDAYDLDRPIPVRYANWMVDAVRGEMGTASSLGGEPVFDLVMRRAVATARLAIPAFVLAAVAAVGLGVLSAVRQYRRVDHVITGLSFLGIALPTFVVGLSLQAFAIWLLNRTGVQVFATQGMRTGSWGDVLRTHTLPIVTLVVVVTAAQARFQRAAMLDVLGSDHLRTARALGLPPHRVILRHGLRNALIPLVTIWAIDMAALLGGSVVTETIFSWPGLGTLLVRAVTSQDLDTTMGIVVVVSVFVVVCNLLADVLYGVLDPRVRRG